MFSFQNTVVYLTLLFSGLVAGLLYGYSCSVNIGLKALPDASYLKAMQAINSAIQNPYFFICFIGLLVLFPLAARNYYLQHASLSFYMIIIAAILYVFGVFAVTVAGNVPLNNRLANFDISAASAKEILGTRFLFERTWNNYHLARTICAILSFLFTIFALAAAGNKAV